jgi:hypothetical protein
MLRTTLVALVCLAAPAAAHANNGKSPNAGGMTACTASLGQCRSDLAAATSALSALRGELAAAHERIAALEGRLSSCEDARDAYATRLRACGEALSGCDAALTSCSVDLDLCHDDLASCEEARAEIPAATGGTATSADGAAFVSVPPGALARDTAVTVTHVARPVVEADRLSEVYDFGPDGLSFAAPATVCLKAADPGDAGACLGYIDTSARVPVWRCEDPCLEKKSTGELCGKTDHFTSFAILLSGSSGGDQCAAGR